jgi:hypothetical protein
MVKSQDQEFLYFEEEKMCPTKPNISIGLALCRKQEIPRIK